MAISQGRPKKKDLSAYISLDLIPDPFVILRPDGTIYDINSSCSELIEVKKEFVIGKDFRNFDLFRKLSERVIQSIINTSEDFERITYNARYFEVLVLPFNMGGDLKLIRIIFKDITSFAHLEKELLKRNKELIIISTLSSAFITSDNLDLVVEDLLKKVLLITDFTVGWLLLREDQDYKIKTSSGISPEFQKKIEKGVLDSLCNDALRIHEPLYIVESSDLSANDLLRKEGIVFLTAIPLVSDKITIGFLFLASRERRAGDIDFDIAALLSLIGNNVSLILDKIKLFHEARRLSITDGLTGLYNRRYFYKYLESEIARTKRYGNTFSVMLFDIDNFKIINDTFGHLAGDDVLQDLAKILRSISRETDIVVRYGGEEFIIILPSTSEKEAITLAERIKTSVEKNSFIVRNSEVVNITLSGGIASYPKNASDARSLLKAADNALYAAKAAGKNRILYFKGKIDEKNIQKAS